MVILPQIDPMLAANFPTTSINAEDVLKRGTTSFVFTELKPSSFEVTVKIGSRQSNGFGYAIKS